MQTRLQDMEMCNRINIIPEFAFSYKMTAQNAYRHLKKYGNLNYLYKHWRALHIKLRKQAQDHKSKDHHIGRLYPFNQFYSVYNKFCITFAKLKTILSYVHY
jgi:hypothetical protein